MAPPLKPNLLIFFVCKEETTWSQSREGAGPSLSLSCARALSLYLKLCLERQEHFLYIAPYMFCHAHRHTDSYQPTHAPVLLMRSTPRFLFSFNLVFLHLQKFLGFQRDTIYRAKGHLLSFSILRDSTCKPCNPSVIVARLLFLILALFILACNYASG